MRRILTDRKIQSLKPASNGRPYDIKDTDVSGLRVRVMGSGHRTFVLLTRFPGSANPTRRAIGSYGDLTLEEAREKARDWRKLLKRGIDPQIEEGRQREAAARRRANTFGAVAEEFIKKKVLGPKCYDEWDKFLNSKADASERKAPTQPPLERKGLEVARDIRRDLIARWRARPITELTRRDVQDVIEAKAERAPAQARNLLGIIKRLFTWSVHQDRYGLDASPADSLKPTMLIGEKVSGQRTLDDVELFALWRAATRMPYPHGPAYQLLILAALRLNEVADAHRSEFDRANKRWVIPAERMKGKNGKARPHAVPLIDDMLAIIDELPHFKKGDYLFSTTFGVSPAWMSDKVKKRIDERMLRTMRALARQRGDDPRKVELKPWTNHDIRRTVRTNLSALRVQEEVREAVLAHVRPGIKGTYDLYDYFDEKREALELWAARLRNIVTPSSDNVVPFMAARG